jgi:hypothetical protein
MIPYDDLVAALTTWRARQGLPTGQIAGAAPPAAAAQAAPQAAHPTPASGPTRRPTPASGRPVTDDSFDVEESALLDEASFDSEFASAFGAVDDGESTSIGSAPSPDEMTRRPPPPRRGR